LRLASRALLGSEEFVHHYLVSPNSLVLIAQPKSCPEFSFLDTTTLSYTGRIQRRPLSL
jgi:hypothetical protein